MVQLFRNRTWSPARATLLAAAACLLMAAPAAAIAFTPSTTAVTLKLTGHPATYARSATAKFAWKVTGAGAKVTCRLGSAAFVKCSKSHSYAGLAAGAHSFTVKLVSGHTTRSVVYKWTVDLTAPTAPTVAGGSTTWTNQTVTISASGSTDTGGSGIASYQHRTSTDSGYSWSAPATGSSLGVATSGATWVQFRAVDRAGNVSAWAPTVPGDPTSVAKVDKIAPTVPTVVSPAASTAATVTVSSNADSTDSGGSGLGTYQNQVSTDGGANWSQATGNSVTVNAAVGTSVTELVQFRSTDGAGNSSPWSTSMNVVLDRAAPVVTVASDHAGWTNAATVNVTATATDAGVGLDATKWAYRTSTSSTCATWTTGTGSAVAVTAPGTTYVEFQARDTLGNTSAWTPASGCPTGAGVVQIDRTAPNPPTSLSGGSTTWKNAAVTMVAGGGSESGTGSGLIATKYVYQISSDNGATWSAASTSAADAVEGTTIVQVATRDNAGNTSSWYPGTSGTGNTVKLDLHAPAVPVVSGGSATWKKVAPVTISATVPADVGPSGVNHDEYQTSTDNGATWSGAVSGTSYAVTLDGRTSVRFRAVDNAGNAGAWSTPDGSTPPAAATVLLDRVVPTVSVTGGSTGWQDATSVTLKATGTDALSGINAAKYTWRSSADGGTTWNGSGSGASAVISAEGDTTVEFQAVDNAGNAAWSAPVHVMLDRKAPTVPVPAGGSTAWFAAADVPVTVTAGGSIDVGSGLDHYQYRTALNGASFSPAKTGASVAVSAPGTTIVEFRSVDALGHASDWSGDTLAGGTVNIDVTNPTAPTVTGGSSNWSGAASMTIKASGSSDATAGAGIPSSGVGHYVYETSPTGDAGTWSTPLQGSSLVVSAEGQTFVRFMAVDRAGNMSAPGPSQAQAQLGLVKLDRLPPDPPSLVGPALNGNGCASVGGAMVEFANDAGSGVASNQYRVDGGAVQTTQYGPIYLPTTPGTYTYELRAIDNLGHISPWTAPVTICVQ